MKTEFQKLGDKALLYSLPVAILGAVLKLQHVHLANQMLLIGLGSIPLGAVLKYFPENRPDAYLTAAAISTGCIAVLFKLMHWPNSEWLINVAIVVAVIWGIKTLFFPDKQTPEEK